MKKSVRLGVGMDGILSNSYSACELRTTTRVLLRKINLSDCQLRHVYEFLHS